MHRLYFALFLFASLLLISPTSTYSQSSLQSPSEFLGYELGSRFTLHYRVMDYFEHVAAQSPQVELVQYGSTYEGRPLVTAYVSSQENMSRLESIRTANLARAGMVDTETDLEPIPAIVWLSYNVHGNESVSTEAALKTIHTLLDPANTEVQTWLANTVVIIDPCLNPDGRDRYVSWYNRSVGRFPDIDGIAREHNEPWPGGRTNHYYFDLNRDWAWLTQKEVQARVAHYNTWMPQIHVDFHEQGVNSPYFFAPAAQPYHGAITPWQREFQQTIGKNHAKYFDQEGWLYFTRQVFDLFYPGYGDTWPTFNGAIGMTYEQAGSGRAGLGIRTLEGDTLTLNDRIDHHYTTGLSTIEITSVHHEEVTRQFQQFFEASSMVTEDDYKSYVIKAPIQSDRLKTLTSYFDAQGITYGIARSGQNLQGYSYTNGTDTRFSVQQGDLVLSAFQPKSTLLQVLFDPNPSLTDSLTYDITSWGLPYVFGLDAYASKTRLAVDTDPPQFQPIVLPDEQQPYVYLSRWESFEDAAFLADLLRQKVRTRYAEKSFMLNGHSYKPGTLVITRTGNTHLSQRFDTIVRETARRHQQPLDAALTGYVDQGSDFGSSDVHFLEPPRVAFLTGESTSPYGSGEVWHYLDQQLGYPSTTLNAQSLRISQLSEIDVLILPPGNYTAIFSQTELNELRDWVRNGGRLIAMGSATSYLANKDGFNLEEKKQGAKKDSVDHATRTYADRDRIAISDNVSGAIFKVDLDTSHPLAFGYEKTYFTLKRSDDVYALLEDEDDWNVGVLAKDGHRSGFVGAKSRDKMASGLILGIQEMGRGDVVYMAESPLFRAFWYNGRLLVANAIFFR